MKIREFLNLTLARVGLKRLNSVELKKLDSVEKLEEVISMKKDIDAPLLLGDYKNEKAHKVIEKLNINQLKKLSKAINDTVDWIVKLLDFNAKTLQENGANLNLRELSIRRNNMVLFIDNFNNALSNTILACESELLRLEEENLDLKEENQALKEKIRKMEETLDIQVKTIALHSKSVDSLTAQLSVLQIESKTDSNKDAIESKNDSNAAIVEIQKEIKSLKDAITPSIPAIQTTQKMMHSDKSGDNNPNSKINEDEFKRLIKEEHKTAKELAEHFDVSVQAIYKRAESLGIKELLKKRKHLPSEKLEVRKIKFD